MTPQAVTSLIIATMAIPGASSLIPAPQKNGRWLVGLFFERKSFLSLDAKREHFDAF